MQRPRTIKDAADLIDVRMKLDLSRSTVKAPLVIRAMIKQLKRIYDVTCKRVTWTDERNDE